MVELKIGLEGIAIAKTQISNIDGEKGRLIYRGVLIEDAVKNHCFEDVVHLLWKGAFPNDSERTALIKELAKHRELPDYIINIISVLTDKSDCMSVVRTAISALVLDGNSWPPSIPQAIQILAKVPTIIAYYYRAKSGKQLIHPNPEFSHVKNYLYMLNGEEPYQSHLRALETYLMISADHDMNASTFTARVVTSTQSDIVSAVVAAIGALKGPLHGGAPSEVDDMLDEIGSEENIEKWLRSELEEGKKIMGFGHRVYKIYDPRAAALKKIVKEFASDSSLFQLSLAVEKKAIELLEEYKPDRKLYTNLEFWASGVLREIQLPRTLYTPTFCVGRVAGWCAQIIEQAENNRIIRPGSIYVGKQPNKN